MNHEIRFGTIDLARREDHVHSWREEAESVSQVQRAMRGRTGRVVARGGNIVTISFTRVRDHETVADAWAFVRGHNRELLAEEATAVDISGPGAASTIVDAAVEMAEAWQEGVASHVSYVIRGAEK